MADVQQIKDRMSRSIAAQQKLREKTERISREGPGESDSDPDASPRTRSTAVNELP